jgi:hypothetical protein
MRYPRKDFIISCQGKSSSTATESLPGLPLQKGQASEKGADGLNFGYLNLFFPHARRSTSDDSPPLDLWKSNSTW